MKTSTLLLSLFLSFGASLASAATPPQVGDTAPNFTLHTLDERPIELQALVAKSPVVLVVLRGWPGYQCPICTKQVHEFATRAAEFKERGAKVLMVYPGPAEKLKAQAQEFLKNKEWPGEFLFVVDPDYTFTNAYGLRWEAKNETAYPSTFVIARGGKIQFAKSSKTHGGRVSATQVLAELK
jgi:thioredoxin-dependent peroxiredoxin